MVKITGMSELIGSFDKMTANAGKVKTAANGVDSLDALRAKLGLASKPRARPLYKTEGEAREAMEKGSDTEDWVYTLQDLADFLTKET